ncbi:MAG TPA: PAS domain S-box protein [Polyangiaceae bacterium]|nr:PAS domain S-box protein [Polyangiaceae bacterium]
MPPRIRTEPGGLPDLKQVAKHLLARIRADARALEELAEHAPDVIARVNADERIPYINLTGERIYGSPRSNIIGKTIPELGLPRETTRQLREGLQVALSTGKAVEPLIELPVKGETLHFQFVFAPEPRDSGRPSSILLCARDVTERRRADDARRQLEAERKARLTAEEAMRRSMVLTEVAALLDSVHDPKEALPRIAELLVTRVADLCVIDAIGEDGTLKRAAVAHALDSKAPLARELLTKFPPRMHVGLSTQDILASRIPRIYSPTTDAHLVSAAYNDDHLRVLRGLGSRSAIAVPLYAHSRPVGSLGLSITESDRQFTLDDTALVVELGRQIAMALDRAHVQSQAQAAWLASERAALHAKKLLDVTLAVSEATSIAEIARRTLEQIGEAIHATSAAIHTLSSDGLTLELLDAVDFGPEKSQIAASIPLEAPLPLPHAVARRQLLLLDGAELASRFPAASRELAGAGAVVCVPLEVEARTIGGLTATFKEKRPKGSSDLQLLQIASRTAAQAIERARLLEATKRSREKAERAANTIARHHQITHELTRAVTSEDVAAILVRELTSALSASGCAVAEIEGDALRILAVAGAEAEALSSRPRVPLLEDEPLSLAAHQGEIVWSSRSPGADPPSGHARVAAPLIASVGAIGAVSLSFQRSSSLNDDERTFLSTVARVGAHALERTRVYHQLARAESKLEAIIHTSPLAIMVFDLDGSVRAWNPAAEAIFGWSAEEAIGRFMPAMPEERRAEFLGCLDALMRGEVLAGRQMLRRKKNGELFPAAVWWARLDNRDESAQCLAIAMDISTSWLGARSQSEDGLKSRSGSGHTRRKP